jgi:hypothetical protein
VAEDANGLTHAMKRVAVTLKQADIPFALAGGYAAYARGGPQPDHDVDFYLREPDVARAEHVLAEAGFRVEHPPEDWLVKVFEGDAMVDLIFHPTGMPVTADVLDRATEVEVDAVCMPVLSATDLLTSKLKALNERYCDFTSLFPTVRALREQVDWAQVRERTADNDFAQCFLDLCGRLSIASPT